MTSRSLGLIACAQCGCAVVGEIKKQRYVYYHCTGYADKCQGNPAPAVANTCGRRFWKRQFTELLGRLKFDDEVLEWVRDAFTPATATNGASTRTRSSATRPNTRGLRIASTRMYVDKLDGLVDAAFFEKMSNEWREAQNNCLREIERHQEADKSYMDDGVQLLELARQAQELFARQPPARKTPLAQLRAIELHLGGWRGGCDVPPTV